MPDKLLSNIIFWEIFLKKNFAGRWFRITGWVENFCTPRMEFTFWSQQEATKHLSVCLEKKNYTKTVYFSVCTHTNRKKKEIVGLHVRVDQEFLPSQSGPIRWELTCALTPLRGRISEHGNTKSGKRKTLIDFARFLMCLPQGPAVLTQFLFFFLFSPRLQLPSNADNAHCVVKWWGLFPACMPQVSWSCGFFLCSWNTRADWQMDRLTDGIQLCLSQRLHLFSRSTCAVYSGKRTSTGCFQQCIKRSLTGRFHAFIRQKAPLVFKVDTIIPLHLTTWDCSHPIECSFEQTGASMSALEPTTASEWSCR